MHVALHDLSKPASRWKGRLAKIAAGLATFYCLGLVGFDYAMHQPPESFSRVMMHTGPAPFVLFPFETMWKHARAGTVQVSDVAPDFTLPLLDHSGFVTISNFRGAKPVALIFGSYT